MVNPYISPFFPHVRSAFRCSVPRQFADVMPGGQAPAHRERTAGTGAWEIHGVGKYLGAIPGIFF